MIIAGSIVGSGELIATTKTGAAAGFSLLWLILLGCVIKVFVQVEFGRYSVVTGMTTMDGLNQVPGPRLGRGNWLVWFWFIMFLGSMGQLGGIVGSVGQAMAISIPLTAAGREFNAHLDAVTESQVARAELRRLRDLDANADGNWDDGSDRRRILGDAIERHERYVKSHATPPKPYDAYLWAVLITGFTSVLLVLGRYNLIQNASTAMVAGFTLVTVITVGMLQSDAAWAVTWSEMAHGMSFRLPAAVAGGSDGFSAIGMALAAFGIIGVGASELVAYPYWCLEKGYARFTGPRNDSAEWADRARGWMRVMRWDTWCSMVIYTFATLAFYLLGAAILGRTGLNPSKDDLIRTLAVMYEPVFGKYAAVLFLFGALAVLYSTFFVANAGLARVLSDALRVLGFVPDSHADHLRRVRWLSGSLPVVCLVMYIAVRQPALLVLISGVLQAVMLPMLSAAALFFRYRRIDPRIAPSRLWDVLLWLSAIGMTITGGWAFVESVQSALGSR
ncbi:MAG: divalent metal cation transporter [Planctomycetes bacterium]|nr:divalent metal cation transporter [Planctomycetota bacterium]